MRTLAVILILLCAYGPAQAADEAPCAGPKNHSHEAKAALQSWNEENGCWEWESYFPTLESAQREAKKLEESGKNEYIWRAVPVPTAEEPQRSKEEQQTSHNG